MKRNQMRSGRMAGNIESTERCWQRSLQRETRREQWPEETGDGELGCPGRKTTAPGHFPILPQGNVQGEITLLPGLWGGAIGELSGLSGLWSHRAGLSQPAVWQLYI